MKLGNTSNKTKQAQQQTNKSNIKRTMRKQQNPLGKPDHIIKQNELKERLEKQLLLHQREEEKHSKEIRKRQEKKQEKLIKEQTIKLSAKILADQLEKNKSEEKHTMEALKNSIKTDLTEGLGYFDRHRKIILSNLIKGQEACDNTLMKIQ